MIRPAVYLACSFILTLLHTGWATEGRFDPSLPVVEIEWHGQANMGQDEFLRPIGVQVGDTVQRDAVRRSLERLYLKGFFSQIRVETAPIREGLKLTYYTTPAAVVQRYEISGNRALAKSTILERLRPQVDERFAEHRLQVSSAGRSLQSQGRSTLEHRALERWFGAAAGLVSARRLPHRALRWTPDRA